MPEEKSLPVDVEVKNVEPLQVEIAEPSESEMVGPAEPEGPIPIRTKSGELSLPPTTTREQDVVTKEQRHISKVWEYSQSAISILITISVIYCQIYGIASETLNNAFFFVIATYLQRTNHTRVGGVGPKADEDVYRGR